MSLLTDHLYTCNEGDHLFSATKSCLKCINLCSAEPVTVREAKIQEHLHLQITNILPLDLNYFPLTREDLE